MSLEIDAVCEMCEKNFKVNSSNVNVTSFITNDGKTVYITWYKCPDCGNIHYIQIDDDNTKKILQDSKAALKQVMVYKSRNVRPPKRLKKKLDDLRINLFNARFNLMVKYNKTVFKYVMSKEEVEIHFSL